MKLLTFVTALVLAQGALAASKTYEIKCGQPAGWAGDTATVTGTLTTGETTPAGASTVTGNLEIVMTSNARLGKQTFTDVTVEGYIDVDLGYANVAVTDKKTAKVLDSIFMSFLDTPTNETSYLTKENGNRVPLGCEMVTASN